MTIANFDLAAQNEFNRPFARLFQSFPANSRAALAEKNILPCAENMSNSMHGERQARSKATDLPRSVANKCPSSFILFYHSHQFFCPAFFLRRAVCDFPTQADQHAKLLGAYSSQERAASARSRRSSMTLALHRK